MLLNHQKKHSLFRHGVYCDRFQSQCRTIIRHSEIILNKLGEVNLKHLTITNELFKPFKFIPLQEDFKPYGSFHRLVLPHFFIALLLMPYNSDTFVVVFQRISLLDGIFVKKSHLTTCGPVHFLHCF